MASLQLVFNSDIVYYMQDLIKKIEELKKALLTIKAKEDLLVPALKMPSVKPLSMPSLSTPPPTKIPGLSPPSNKDPKKVAQQLKNPRPKKPNMEILKTDQNGQWSLE